MPKTGRNDLCPCGSGRKFKRCCEGKQNTRDSRFLIFAVGGAILAALAVGAISFTGDGSRASGRVWSAEHGHYHDVGTGTASTTGRVWSEEHGHYH